MTMTNSDAMLRVAIISKATSDGGGASRVAEDLARQLNRADSVTADHWVGELLAPMEPHFRLLHSKGMYLKAYKASALMSRVVGLPDLLTPEILALIRHGLHNYDIYHFHDISTAFSPLSLRWLAKRRPVVWTFHDLSPFTGGCIFPMDCTRYQERCGSCPQLLNWPLQTRVDFTGLMQDQKRAIAADDTITAIAPSRWIAGQATQHGGWNSPTIIPYSVDTALFRPLERHAIRSILGLDIHRFYVVLSAFFLHDKRKGTDHALEALRRCGRPIGVILLGHASDGIADTLPGLDVRAVGYLSRKDHLAMYYAAADAYLFPTIQDNLPNSVLETMACGTPTIGFSVGGVPEMVTHLEHGWLTDLGDVSGLIAGLHFAMDNSEKWLACGRSSAVRCRTEYTQERFTQKHLALYKSILASRHD